MSRPGLNEARVLIVDDQVFMRKLLRDFLTRMGVARVVEAKDGREGLTEVAGLKPHVVICDVHMEGLNGLDFLRELRAAKDPVMALTPVVFVSGDESKESRETVLQEVHVDYVEKPVSFNTLKGKIEAALIKSRVAGAMAG